jgi:hypothetical protein
MNKALAWLISIIIVIQIATVSFEQLPGNIDFESEDNQTNITSGRNNTTCGFDASLTDLMAWTDAVSYISGATVYADYYVNCSVINKDYMLEADWSGNNGWSSYNIWNWTETDGWESFSESWPNISDGYYCGNITLWMISGGATNFIDSETPCFNVTGGNNTGGNNTGGNNTGGNNTGGNNTGGNNTGGNNTNTSCMGSMQIFDGTVDITGVNPVYDIGDPFNANFITCWIPSNTSMSLMGWLNGSNGLNYDIQVYSGGNNWPATVGAQNLGTNGYWMFPISDIASMFGMDYTALSIPAGNYCWEALLKVYDGNLFIPVDTDTSCFTVNNNTVLDPCGLDPTLISVYSWTDASTYNVGDTQDLSFYVNCTRIGTNYTLEYYVSEVGSTAYVISGSWTWTASQTNAAFNDVLSGLGPGDYCVLGNLYEWGVFLIDDGGTTCFTVTGTNTAPQVSMVIISPSSPTEVDTLVCTYTYYDADNDPDNSFVAWTINGAPVTTATTTLSSGYAPGNFVTCAILAHDGIQNGNIATSTVVIANSSGSTSGGSVPFVGVAGTIAVISLSCLVALRRENE